jgi:hypothetical protein
MAAGPVVQLKKKTWWRDATRCDAQQGMFGATVARSVLQLLRRRPNRTQCRSSYLPESMRTIDRVALWTLRKSTTGVCFLEPLL